MSVLDRYLTRQCLIAIATVIAVLATLTLLFALIEELDKGSATYGFVQALEYLLLTMPRRIEELMSYGVFVGLLLALGNLSEGGELTAIRAAGVSPYRILAALLPTLGICLLLGLTLSEWASPTGERAAEQFKRAAIAASLPVASGHTDTRATFVTPQEGIWLRRNVGQGAEFAHIASMNQQGDMANIQIYEIDESNRLLASRYAEKGSFDNEEGFWRLHRVRSTTLSERRSASFEEEQRAWSKLTTFTGWR